MRNALGLLTPSSLTSHNIKLALQQELAIYLGLLNRHPDSKFGGDLEQNSSLTTADVKSLTLDFQIQNPDHRPSPKLGWDLGSGQNLSLTASAVKSLTLNLGVLPVIISNSLAMASITMITFTSKWLIFPLFLMS